MRLESLISFLRKLPAVAPKWSTADQERAMRRVLHRREDLIATGDSYSFLNLWGLLTDFRGARCREDNDLVYSLLGLINWDNTPHIQRLQVDYTVSRDDLAQQVIDLTRSALQQQHHIGQVAGLIAYFEDVWGYTARRLSTLSSGSG